MNLDAVQRHARKQAILIIAAGTAGDNVRLASGERVGGLWTFASKAAEMERMEQMIAALYSHGLTLKDCAVPVAADGIYAVTRAAQVVEID